MAAPPQPTIEELIQRWRESAVRAPDGRGASREAELREEATALGADGLTPNEAFLIAVARREGGSAASREFAHARLDEICRTSAGAIRGAAETAAEKRRESLVALGMAVVAAAAVKAPALFGRHFETNGPFYARNASLLVLPALAIYLAWRAAAGRERRPDAAASTWRTGSLWLTAAFVAGAACANLYPFGGTSETAILTALHLPLTLWLAIGFVFFRGGWSGNADRGSGEFARFSGELVIRYALIALGGGVFTGLTLALFRAIGIDAGAAASNWLVPCGAAGALTVAAWLVKTQRNAAGALAPLLTRLFTPLFTALLLLFLGAMWSGHALRADRDVLIAFDGLLALVVGLVLFAVPGRDAEGPGWFDKLQLSMIVSAVAVDATLLANVAGRISRLGFTPNRVAGLGENLILLVNLAGSAWLMTAFLVRRHRRASLERWQLAFLKVYAGWAWLVVIAFPPLFGFR